MMHRSRGWRFLAFLLPTLALVLVFGAGSAQEETSRTLFDPVYDIYRQIQSFFYRPELIDDQEALYGAMRGVVEHLDDPYSEFLDPQDRERFDESLDGEFSGVGIEITLVDGYLTVITPLVGTPAEAAGILAGDKILAIDEESTDGISLSEAAYLIRGEIGTTVVLTVRHEDESIEEIPIERDTIVIEAVRSELVADGTVGHIRILRFERDTINELDAALASFDLDNLTGLILDLRNNPGGLMDQAISVSSRFVDEGVVLRTESRLQGNRSFYTKSNSVPNLPLVVLINRGTASASEITAGAIRDNQMGVLIGGKSFGKGVFQQVLSFEDGSALKITTGEYFTPNGTIVDGVGLTPDIVLEEDEDPIEAAIAWIQDHEGVTMPIELGPLPTP
ncbi:MAG: S41 family peptidase [Candidatus Bipolaricaulia bacterium]